MKKTETNTSRLQYSQPKSREIRVMAQGLMCQSPSEYGDTGYAGNGYNNDNTTNYDIDF